MPVTDTSSEGADRSTEPVEPMPAERTVANLDEINAKLDLLLQAQGISYERE